MIPGSVARRYAKALMDIGVANRTYEGLGREIQRLGKAFASSPELREALSNPVFLLSQRRKLLEELCRRLAVSKTVHNFTMLLLERNRISSLPDIARQIRAMVDLQAGRVRAKVTSAKPLDMAAEVRIKSALERTTGKTVVLEKSEDPALLGGIVTQLGDTVYDGSLVTQLNNMRQRLLGE